MERENAEFLTALAFAGCGPLAKELRRLSDLENFWTVDFTPVVVAPPELRADRSILRSDFPAILRSIFSRVFRSILSPVFRSVLSPVF